jgi:hypothetical protein
VGIHLQLIGGHDNGLNPGAQNQLGQQSKTLFQNNNKNKINKSFWTSL